VTARPAEGGAGVVLTVEGRDAQRNAAWLAGWIRAYEAHRQQQLTKPERDPEWLAWQQALRALEQRREALQAQIAHIESRRQRLPETPGWDAARRKLDDLQAELSATQETLVRDRQRLQVLRLEPVRRGTLTGKQVAEALARDVVYQEDSKELETVARQYRSELAVAMVGVLDPLRSLQDAGRSLSEAVKEQIGLGPPAPTRAVLERCAENVEELNRVLAQFAQDWEARKQTVERLKIPDDLPTLLEQQAEASHSAARVALQVDRLLNALRDQVGGLTRQPQAGTRETVVASVLRGEISVVAERLDALAEAAQAADRRSNVDIDAAHRRLRGLARRLR